MNGFWQSVMDASAPRGTAVLWWLGQMGLLVKMGDTVLCVDLYASESPKSWFRRPLPRTKRRG